MSDEERYKDYDDWLHEATHKRISIPYRVTLTFNLEVDIPNCSEDDIEDEIDYAIDKLDFDEDILKGCEYEFEDAEWNEYEEVSWRAR